MSMNNLTIDGEFRYVVQWFNEWSELQRDDFIPILLDYLKSSAATTELETRRATAASMPSKASEGSGAELDEINTAANVALERNGIENDMKTSLNSNDKPMSLFQCRIKLFAQWHSFWPQDFKEKLLQKIYEIDPKVHQKLNEQFQKSSTSLSSPIPSSTQSQTASVNADINHISNSINQTENLTEMMTETCINHDQVDDFQLVDNKIQENKTVEEGTTHTVERIASNTADNANDGKREIGNEVADNNNEKNEVNTYEAASSAHIMLMKPVQIAVDDIVLESLSADAVENMKITDVEILQQQQQQQQQQTQSTKLSMEVTVGEPPLVA